MPKSDAPVVWLATWADNENWEDISEVLGVFSTVERARDACVHHTTVVRKLPAPELSWSTFAGGCEWTEVGLRQAYEVEPCQLDLPLFLSKIGILDRFRPKQEAST